MRVVVTSLLGALALVACGPDDNEEATCKEALVAGDLVITEVFADFQAQGGTGADEGKEWIEVYNAANRPVELAGLRVVHGRPDGSRQKSHVIDDVTIAPGQFFTLGNATQDLLPPYIDYGYSADLGDLFNTDGGKLDLKCGEAVIDSARYDAVASGRSRQLSAAQPPDYTANDDLASWCEASDTEFETGNFGTPGQNNDCTPVVIGQCNDRGTMRDTVPPQPGQLIITEVMPSPRVATDAMGEWFEARATASFDLNGIGLDRSNGPAMPPDVVQAPECLRVDAGDHVVFARNLDPAINGGVWPVRGTFKFSMVSGSAASPGDVQILYGTTVIDAITWTRSVTGAALQLDPDLIDATSNDMESSFCNATEAYNSGVSGAPPIPPDRGTPGMLNTQCSTLPGPGTCDDGGTIRAIVRPTPGQLVISELLSNPAPVEGGSDARREWFEVVNVGPGQFDLNGLGLARASTTTPNIITSAACLELPARAYAVFARSNDRTVNGMLPRVDATFSFSLVDAMGDVQVRDGATVLDAVTWPSSMSGVSRQLDPTKLTTTANDLEASFCAGTTPYGDLSNRGTPGAANVCP